MRAGERGGVARLGDFVVSSTSGWIWGGATSVGRLDRRLRARGDVHAELRHELDVVHLVVVGHGDVAAVGLDVVHLHHAHLHEETTPQATA